VLERWALELNEEAQDREPSRSFAPDDGTTVVGSNAQLCGVSGNVVSVDAVLVPNVIADVQLGWDDKFLGANMLNLVSE
jgi:hypothetical protein